MTEVQNQEEILNSPQKPTGADGMEIIFFTDPLCCWSWAMEPHWRKFQDEYGERLRVTYKMIGLLPSWAHFHDAAHSLRKPVHFGPEWVHARAISGMQLNDRIWITDPPASSFPACIAVKSAELQSRALGARYLQLVREAIMVNGRNIAKTSVLIAVAGDLAGEEPRFDISRFRDTLLGQEGREQFQRDYNESQYLGIRRTPTLVFKSIGGRRKMASGYSTYEAMAEAAAASNL
jgi:putative protein-disulfide isomerase